MSIIETAEVQTSRAVAVEEARDLAVGNVIAFPILPPQTN